MLFQIENQYCYGLKILPKTVDLNLRYEMNTNKHNIANHNGYNHCLNSCNYITRHKLACIKILQKFLTLPSPIYQPLRLGRIWHKVNF